MPENKFSPPYYGGVYSPEITELPEAGFDIEMMKKSGFNVVKIGDNGWNIVEKSKGVFDFSFYTELLSKLKKNGIAAVFSLPVFSPPMWQVKEVKTEFCPSNAEYIGSASYMVRETVKALDSFDNIIAWTVSVPENEPCFCEDCRRRFAKSLSEEYKGSVEKLNFTLNDSAEGAFYSSFEELAADQTGIISNPHLNLKWKAFRSSEKARLIKETAAKIKEISKKPFGVSFSYKSPDLSLFSELSDFPCVSFDFCREDRYFPYYMNYFSQLRLKRFFAFSSFENAAESPIERKDKNYHSFRVLFPYLTGGCGSAYWYFRNHRSGKHTECDALLSSEGRPTVHSKEAAAVGEKIRTAADFLNHTVSSAPAAVIYSSFSKRFFEAQQSFKISDYDALLFENFCEPIKRKGVETDITDGSCDFSSYKVIFSPMTVSLETDIGIRKIENWVRNGGVWICGPLSDIRDKNGIKYRRSPFGQLETLTGAYLFHRVFSRKPVDAVWTDGKPFEGFLWYDIFDSSENDLVTVSDSDAEFSGKALVKSISFGKGKIILLGTFPSFSDMEKITDYALSFAGIKKFRCSENVWFSFRRGYDDFGKEYKGLVLAEYKGKEGTVRLSKAYVDLFSGKMLKGIIKTEPYCCMALEEVSEK